MLEQINAPFSLKSDAASNGAEALKMLSEKLTTCCGEPYKLIFVDLNMPIMGGYDMMAEVQKLIKEGSLKGYADSVFVVCTAQSENFMKNYH